MSGQQPQVAQTIRAFMRRLGFQSPSVKQSKDVPGQWIVTAYDPVDRYNFCRSYTLEDLKCIAHANLIFWRFIK